MNAPKKIETVVFDLGGVLVDWNPRYLYRKLISSADEIEYFLTHVCNREWNEEQDHGRPFAEAVRLLEAKFPEKSALIRAYHERWEEMLRGEIAGTVALLEELHAQGMHLLALSNWSHETFPIAERRFPFLRLFHGKVVSGYEKLKKPDPRIFQLLVRRFQIEPRRSLFIDDVEENIRAAERLGFEVAHFRDPVILRQRFQDFQLVPTRPSGSDKSGP